MASLTADRAQECQTQQRQRQHRHGPHSATHHAAIHGHRISRGHVGRSVRAVWIAAEVGVVFDDLAGVADAVAVRIALVGVGHVGAIIDAVRDAVAV